MSYFRYVSYLVLFLTLLSCSKIGTKKEYLKISEQREEKYRKKPALRDKIGSMLMFGFHGAKSSDEGVQEIIRDIKNYKVGGVILFKYNILSHGQLINLTDALKQVDNKLFIAVDQEGGLVERLNDKNGFIHTNSAKNMVANYTPYKAYNIYYDMAKMLKTNGVNFNFAPCVDVDRIPTCSVIGKLGRSFSNDVNKVIQHSKAFVKAHKNQHILTALKHFPGHGFAQGDTHKGVTDTTYTANPIIELKPYQELLANSTYTAVMVAHVVNRNLDPEGLPATLSKPIVTGLLREKLGFQGVVVTGVLEMGAIRNYYSLEEVVILAINAGNDILVFSMNSAVSADAEQNSLWNISPNKIIEIIEKAVLEGKISQKRIEESYSRITKFKKLI